MSELWLAEHKTKGEVDEVTIQKQLTFDIQVMFYLVAMAEAQKGGLYGLEKYGHPRGVKFNVVRRPLSGGKGTIVRHKPTKSNPVGETEHDYYQRLRAYIADEPGTYFYRWTVDVTPEDVERFKREFLDPCLEFVCFWYDTHTVKDRVTSSPGNMCHWRTPYGLVGEITDGYGSDLDYYLDTGSTVGLVRSETLFPELTNV
jgi:hypothetical protein